MTDPSLPDLTLAELRLALAPALAQAAVFDGWSHAALRTAAAAQGHDPDMAELAFAGNAEPVAMTMISAWVARIDADMALALPAELLTTLPVRERIRRLVQFRLDAVSGLDEALRRALAIMVMPQHVPAALRLGWRSADVMWRLAGDVSADYNHYTKRTILAGIYAATLQVFAYDNSPNKAEARAFLDRRIAGVMQFEKTKARVLARPDLMFSPARFLGRLRYPAG